VSVHVHGMQHEHGGNLGCGYLSTIKDFAAGTAE
jgi:hypothetical protein